MIRSIRSKTRRTRLAALSGIVGVMLMARPVVASEAGDLHEIAAASLQPTVNVSCGGEDEGAPRGTCPIQLITHTDAVLPDPEQGGSVPPQNFVLFGGIVETEIVASSYALSAADFPISLERIEFGFGQTGAIVTTTTHWTVIVYAGTPQSGSIVSTISSDGFFYNHIELPPGDQGTIQSLPLTPPIVVNDNGSHTFSIGVRIDEHNDPPVSACDGGLTPARCCVHNPQTNAFPLEDASGIDAPSHNWLWASNCGPFSIPSGWHLTNSIGLSGDWVIRASYRPANCIETGACCDPDTGSCVVLSQADCQSQGNTWQGGGTDCSPNPCPEPTGACCRPDGFCDESTPMSQCQGAGNLFHESLACSAIPEPCPQPPGACCVGSGCSVIPEEDCGNQAGVFRGAGTACDANACNGACCNPINGFCSSQSAPNCAGFGGQFQGVGIACSGNQCPTAACCHPDGTCTTATPFSCAGAGGDWLSGQACAANPCPIPTGACCLAGGGCLVSEQAPCEGFGNTWAGPGSACPDDCAAPCDEATGDINTDGDIDGRDVNRFVAATLGSATPEEICAGDFDGSASLGAEDIPDFVAELLGS